MTEDQERADDADDESLIAGQRVERPRKKSEKDENEAQAGNRPQPPELGSRPPLIASAEG
jgi:hypothetical protein